LNNIFKNRVILVVQKKIFDSMRDPKSAIFIKANGHWTITRTNEHGFTSASVIIENVFHKKRTIALAASREGRGGIDLNSDGQRGAGKADAGTG
jgi:hypothetical protein